MIAERDHPGASAPIPPSGDGSDRGLFPVHGGGTGEQQGNAADLALRLFDGSPFATWIEDYSSAKRFIDELKRRGTRDLGKYFDEHADLLGEIAAAIEVLRVNPAALRIHRAPDAKAFHEALLRRRSQPCFLRFFGQRLAALAEGAGSFVLEYEVEAADGTPLYLRNASYLTADESATWSVVVSIEEDVTQTRKHDLEHRLREARLEAIVENVESLVALEDIDGHYIFVNEAFCKFFKVKRDEVLYRRFSDVLPGAAADEAKGHREEVARKRRSVERTYRFPFKNGARYLGSVRFPVAEKSGGLMAIGFVGNDITERVKAEEKIKQREAELARVLRHAVVGEMASSLAHELNQPLAALVYYARGSLRRLESGTERPEGLKDVLGKIAGQAERAAGVIHRLREFAWNGKRDLKQVDANEMVRTVVELADSLLGLNKVRTSLDLSDRPALARVDPIEVEQVILNLVLNAVEAMAGTAEAERELSVRTSRTREGAVEIVVGDTGPGIPDSCRERIFEPFFTTKPKGTGMGLAISRTLIARYGGSVEAGRAIRGNGARFRITIPAS